MRLLAEKLGNYVVVDIYKIKFSHIWCLWLGLMLVKTNRFSQRFGGNYKIVSFLSTFIGQPILEASILKLCSCSNRVNKLTWQPMVKEPVLNNPNPTWSFRALLWKHRLLGPSVFSPLFLPPQHFITYQHGSIRCWLILPPSHGSLPWGKPLLIAYPPAELGGGQLRHPLSHQAHAASHRSRQLQDFPWALCQRNPEKAWEPGR